MRNVLMAAAVVLASTFPGTAAAGGDKALKRCLAFKASKAAEGVKDCTEAIERSSKDPASLVKAYMSRGEAHGFLKEYAAGIADFDAVIAQDRAGELTPYAYSARGRCKSALGQHEGSLGDYNLAIGLKPDNPVTYVWRSQTHLLLNKPYQAEADARAALSKESLAAQGPWSAAARNLLGYALFEQDRWAEAAAAFAEPRPTAETDQKAHALLGSALVALRQGDPKKARDLRAQAEALAPDLHAGQFAPKSAAAYEELAK